MGSTRFDVEKLTDKVDFGLWKVKVKALLIQQGLGTTLMKKPEGGTGKEKVEDQAVINEKAHSLIILCLSDKALREVAKKTSAIGVWEKLESLYVMKTLANRLYMKQKLYSFKMAEEKPILKQPDEFNNVLDDLDNIEVKLEP